MAIYHDRPKVLIAEVKRDKRNFKRQPFMEKVELLRAKYFDKYEVEPRCFSLTDMWNQARRPHRARTFPDPQPTTLN